MDFFTRCCKKTDLLCFLALLCWAVDASAEGVSIKSAELVPVASSYQLHANFQIEFPADIEKALNKGVVLDFLVEFQLATPRKYWFDDEIITTTRHVELSFHALSRQYLLKVGRHQTSFSTLVEAKDELSRISDWIVFNQSLVTKGEPYEAILRFRLDPSRLPKALQIEGLSSEKWTMVSERYRWIPEF